MMTREIILKILWAFLNLKKPKLNVIGKITDKKFYAKKVLLVAIDYDKFTSRKVKRVGGVFYECGGYSLNNIINFSKNRKIDFIHLITTDDIRKVSERVVVNQTCYVINYGTDIAALISIKHMLSDYEVVIVGNSSCAVEDSLRMENMIEEISNSQGSPFVAGFNGNSKISPSFPFNITQYPHVITNFFAARSLEVLEILESEKFYKIERLKFNYGNKYFAIRYFETMLSSWVLHKGGKLILITDNRIVFPSEIHNWPKKDTRLVRFYRAERVLIDST